MMTGFRIALIASAALTAKYKWDPLTFYGGWIYARLMNPSDGRTILRH